MSGSLIAYDVECFFKKYTRFMSKDIYISIDMSKRFLDSYRYLLEEVEKNHYLYEDQVDFHKLVSIFKRHNEVLKLHNCKYLSRALTRYSDIFVDSDLSKVYRQMILCDEDKMVCFGVSKYVSFIVSKICYLHRVHHIDYDKILVLCDDVLEMNSVLDKCHFFSYDVSCYDLMGVNFGELLGVSNYLEYSKLYQLLFFYIRDVLFLDKEKFLKFYHAFSNEVYLSDDFKDFHSFHDYHVSFWNNKFFISGKSLKSFCKEELKKRRGHLRTALSEFVVCKEEVDIANFLYLNSIDYVYDKDRRCFCFSSLRGDIYVSFFDVNVDNLILLDLSDKKFLEKLTYELIKRQVPFELRSDDYVFRSLVSTSDDSYFSDFISNILIPFIECYRKGISYDNMCFSKEQLEVLQGFCSYYDKFIKDNHYCDKVSLLDMTKRFCNGGDYEYIIYLGDEDFHIEKKYLQVIKRDMTLDFPLKNVSLFYEYKSYLGESKCLSVLNTYVDLGEFRSLTQSFFAHHLSFINQNMSSISKMVRVCYYDDTNRFRTFRSLAVCVNDFLVGVGEDVVLSFERLSDSKVLVDGECFVRVNRNTLRCSSGEFCCVEGVGDKEYGMVVLPYLIRDSYHRNYFEDDSYKIKMGIYLALQCSCNGICVMCPSSRKEEMARVFDKIFRVVYL